MAQIISKRHRVQENRKVLEFEPIGLGKSNGWYSFSADDDYNPVFDNQLQRYSWEMISKDDGYVGPFRRVEKHTYTEYARAICECGKEIELYAQYMGACECPHCGRWHNLFGQELLPPEQWGDTDYDY